jgi:two-component system OmpR family sensor kinase
MSLRTRVLAGLATVAFVLAVAAWGITTTTRDHLVDQVDDRLTASASPNRDGQFGGQPPQPPADPPDGPPERLSDVFEGYISENSDLEAIFEPNTPGKEYSPPDISWDDVTGAEGDPFTVSSVDGDTTYRAVATPAENGAFVRAIPLDDVDETVNQLILFQVIGVSVVLLVLAAVGWWVIRLGIRPIRAMTRSADEISEDALSVRVPEPSAEGTEVAALAHTLNTMLDRIETAVDRQASSEERLRRFVADASHELRTPVTTIRGYAELYRHGGLGGKDELDDAMRRTEQEAGRMARLVEDMLTLAKLDEKRPMEHATVDLSAMLTDIVADGRANAPDHHLAGRVETDLEVVGDEDRLRQLLVNVVGNAVVHTPSGTTITVEARSDGTDVVVDVSDDGPGMDPEAAERATERLYRADTARSRARGGSGLGLSIARDVADAHQGDLSVSSGTGDGTRVTLRLPTSA